MAHPQLSMGRSIMRFLNKQLALLGFLLATTAPALAQQAIRLSTTTSTENSGLLQYLLPKFESKTNYRVSVISVGTSFTLVTEIMNGFANERPLASVERMRTV